MSLNPARFTLPGSELHHTINSVVHATSHDPPYKKLKDKNIDLRNVCFEIQLDSFRAIATDQKRLSVASTQIKSNIGSGYCVTMYRMNAKDMIRMYKNHDSITGHIHKGLLHIDDHYMNVEPSEVETRLMYKQSFRLENDKFINWRKNVPYAKKPLMVKLDTRMFKMALMDMFKGVTRKMIPSHKRGVVLTMCDNTVTLRSSNMTAEEAKGKQSLFEYGEKDPEGLRILADQVETTFEVETPKPRYMIWLNPVYLLDAVNSIRDEEFMFAHGDESNLMIHEHIDGNVVLTPISIFNVHYQLAPVDSPYLHIIMPMNPDPGRPRNSF